MALPGTQVPLIIIIPGLFFLTIGLLLIIKRIRFLRNARDVLGEVILLKKRYPSGLFDQRGYPAMPCHLPQVRFRADNGKEYTFVGNYSSHFLSPRVGSKIPVVYDPRDPRRAFIKHVLTLWSRPVIIFAFGALLLVFVISIA
jgi:hypothetical protein